MSRNREKTERKILEAAIRLLREKGFSGWGINSVARAAVVDKVLIYRYYGSLDGLLEEIVRATRFWPDPDSIDADSGEAFIAGTIEILMENPVWKLLITLPAGDPGRLLADRQSADDLDTWLAGIRRKCTGHITDKELTGLAALVQFQAINVSSRMPAGDLWGTVSPPLQWKKQHDFQAFEELPTELL